MASKAQADWADTEAREIILAIAQAHETHELHAASFVQTADYIAARLRVIHANGITEGLDRAKQAIRADAA
jgi:hypothetical protein